MGQTKVLAHRGYSAKAPENTMAAFRLAAEAGADGLELDVHLSKDGEVVVIHDETVKRTTGKKGKVTNLTLEEIRRLDAGSWLHDHFAGEPIPTLDEVLSLTADKGLWINIELKNNKIRYPGLEQAVLERVDRYGMAERTIISSFNHYSLRTIHELRPEMDTAILYMADLFEPWQYARHVGVSSLHPYWPTVREETVYGCQQAGLPVRPFTVNRQQEMRRLLQLSVEAIITDHVTVLLEERRATVPDGAACE
ncbi:glycerophosphodiester phosphodiesterase [Desmospora activa]|uniref:Glycerophosphoryl diester phosphodiesterase n=1 Tax=Desmospora activa DSM 45169 TaxID=1121389 RepID=A0A2T4ZBM4_9BACL|nr:glycerophosphodiester phosphodiesterase [Desmospora activa]PTM59277.1 glycerophosphoryl diester phosphodiesterase [Desmospora activa DSM 45169]